MNIYCKKSELNKAITTVSHAIPTRTTSDVLSGILFEVKDSEAQLSATDTNITVKTRIKVSCDSDCSTVIAAKLFSSIVSKLPEEDVLLDFDNNKEKLVIKSGNSSTEMVCFSADGFPIIKVKEDGEKITINKEIVKNLIRKTSFSASREELNGILTGVLVQSKDNNLKMVAIDSFRLALNNEKIEDNKEMNKVVPARMLEEVAKIIYDDGDENVSIESLDNKVVFQFDETTVIVNTLNGEFIDYKRIIEKESTIKIRLKKEELYNCMDRAILLTSTKSNNLIKWDINDDILNISSLSEEGKIEEKIEIIKDGENIQIGFNGRFIMDILKAIEDEEIIINMKDNTSPCIITPLQGERFLYLVLPVRIN